MTVWDDILSNPANLRSIIHSHVSNNAAPLIQAAALIRKAGRVVYAGVGSGMNACIPAVYYLMGHGFPAEYLDATEALYGLFPGLKGCAIVLNTRSGETAEVIRLGERARAAGIPVITVTNEPGSTAGRLADVCLPNHSRWDELVVISAYIGMVSAELVLAGMVIDHPDAMLLDLQDAASAMDGVLKQAIDLRQDLLAVVRRASPIYLLGRGPSLASAHGGALVIQETSRRSCLAMASGLFRQGPIEAVNQDFRAVVFEGRDETSALSHRLCQELLDNQAGLVWIGRSTLEGALNFPLPDLPAHVLPLLEILPCQVLAYDLALDSGVQPGDVRYIQRVITREAGIQGS
jgi:glucosamine--fructose-6-phosphate aminotransferase (isomerizing)